MRDRVQLQAPVHTPDGQGGFKLTWKTKAKVWANVQQLSGREYLIAQQLGTALSHTVLIRYFEGIDPSWRVLTQDNRQLNIRSVVNPDSMKIEHSLYCEQIVPSVD
jgi:SPP1 family predicted phage head-tail adaptor